MSHLFEVGKTYRTRVGEYIVLAIEGNEMTIRYADGEIVRTKTNIQARIWENIQFEEGRAREEERRQLAQESRQSIRKQPNHPPQFRSGLPAFRFQDVDFGPRKRGVAWSTREHLGPALAAELSQLTGETFGYWIVPRESEVRVARKGYYDPRTRERNAGLFVAVTAEQVCYGLCVGKPAGTLNPDWPWALFWTALDRSDRLRKLLRSTMESHGLALDVHAGWMSQARLGRIHSRGDGFVRQSQIMGEPIVESMDWRAFLAYMEGVGTQGRCSLYLSNGLSADSALQVGMAITGEIASMLETLLPLYYASTGGQA